MKTMKIFSQMKNINILFILGISIIIFTFSSCGSSEEKKTEQKPDLKVKIETVSVEDHARTFSYSGKIEARYHSVLSTRIMGNVTKVYVSPGQKVQKGQVLLKINDKDILSKKAQIKSTQIAAEAAFANAEKDYKRYKSLFEKKSASQKELDDISTQYKMAKAQLEATKEMEKELNETLKYATIRAPYAGVISKKYINKGDFASPGMPLLAIEQTKELNVVARIPESEISCIEVGDIVDVQVNAVNKMNVKGEVIEVNLSAQHTGSQYEVKIKLNPEVEQKTLLRSGMYANVILVKGGQPSIYVPEKAIVYKGQLCGIYTVSQSKTALLRWVRLGKKRGDQVEIISGLADGEKFIKSYTGKIWDGASIQIVK